MPPIMDPKMIRKELEKPIEVDKEIKFAYGIPLDGSEKPSLYQLRDKWTITRELERLYKLMTKDATPDSAGKKRFILTAGGPGSGKTSMIRQLQKIDGDCLKPVHVDPDEILKEMRPYQKLIKNLGGSDLGITAAYTYWRWASIYLANSIINKLSEDGYDILFGTTGTSPAVAKLYDSAHQAGYETSVLICHAPESVRLASAEARFKNERRFTPEADLKNKGNKMFPDALMIHFLKAAEIKVYWRATFNSDPILALETKNGKVITRNEKAKTAFIEEIQKYRPELDWNSIITAYETRFRPQTKNSQLKF